PIDTIQNPISGIPVRLVIPSMGHSVDVIPGTHNLKNQTWTLSNTQAQYATNTQPLNTQSGSTVIYGHNTQAVFGKLSGLKTGDTVLVYTEKGALFAYTLEGSFSTVPTDTSVFDKQGGKPSLQLLTCTGTWSENRRILNLSLKEVR
nr:sortase [Candidatus Saccharibacteria bacterium]